MPRLKGKRNNYETALDLEANRIEVALTNAAIAVELEIPLRTWELLCEGLIRNLTGHSRVMQHARDLRSRAATKQKRSAQGP